MTEAPGDVGVPGAPEPSAEAFGRRCGGSHQRVGAAVGPRRRGSSAKYKRSTLKFTSTNTAATNMRYAAITGISTNWTAWMNSAPRPGHWNTLSVTIAKAITEPN